MGARLLDGLDVSRETNEALHELSADLLKWTKRINLIAPSTQDDIWARHIQDSAQLWPLRDANPEKWCDIGSGGGLPGLVLALLAKGEGAALDFTFIESDTRKCAFLTTMATKFSLKATVIAERIEVAPPVEADILSARALAPLPKLLDLATRHATPNSVFLLQKGAQFENEIDAARDSWHFKYETIPSQTHPDAVVLKIKEVARA
ncbi:16S rRNA (guanine(527)-N(7))-methyltransferase RsmG [Cognatishimia sp. MH4019]|uniref:16S rRNA (guanine(527)-N(7))-methyltransferase RsmG n=1 Tax=Cognatishimia sp. MH4019 TaxID=2854030 RepID=UPI001CD7F5DF|nr:16S rRNA (guanine(527)-N(7))-methyltransferase RsmG [Cognatishimia sp. MH4019]